MGKYFVIFALFISAIVALIYQSSERAVQVKPFSEETQLERIRLQRTHPISFPKGSILLTEVRKHPKLQNESEVEAYFYIQRPPTHVAYYRTTRTYLMG